MEFKTVSGKTVTINNVTVHYYPNVKYIAKCAVHIRHDSKIIWRFAMKDPAAVSSYMARQGWQDLPMKMYTHRG